MTADALADFVRGPLDAESQALLRRTFDDEVLDPRPDLTAAGRHALTHRRLRHVNTALGPGSALLGDRVRLDAAFGWAAVADPALFHAMVLHYPLCLGVLLDLDPGTPEVAGAVAALEKLEAAGVLLLTEAGVSGSHLDPGTEAVHDPATGGFVLRTPRPEAAKFPTATGAPGVARIAAVYARVIVAGADRGVFPFAVTVRGADGRVTPGVGVTPAAEAAGLPADYAAVTFDDVPVPYGAWLRGSARLDGGGFHDPLGSRPARLARSLAMARPVWRGIVSACAAVTRAAVTMALAHTRHRRTAGGTPLMDFRRQRRDLLAALADAYALTALAGSFAEGDGAAVTGALTPWALIDARLPALKAVAVSTAAAAVDVCRARCGAPANAATGRYTGYRALLDAYTSAGGDNLLIWLDTARALLDAPPPGASALEARAREELAVAIARDGDWNAHVHLAERAALAHADRVLQDAFAERAAAVAEPGARDLLTRLAALRGHALTLRRSGDLLETAVLSPSAIGRSRVALDALCDGLADRVPELTAAFGLPARLLDPVFGTPDFARALIGGEVP
ncbi:hypothetical protein Afil01_26430 [Actinorhabdospora filicis]|uniref:Acyl-CoA oxidase n=1 Tax=Actinorhabdospora filicis TaxID=1785913 RepID=A0A9W6SL92_9ACTN|nr:acyl-CoA dehydrogenase [Actinorhabdospora filicis]GLZ77836.1 hypothetical protein Afil01_26430 [Actinorhabdospora filicis]